MELEKQEHNIFNKPSILVNIAHSVDISLNSLKVYNYVIRELFKADIEKNTSITTTFKEIANSLGYNANYSSLEILNYLIELEDCLIKTKTFNYKRNDWTDNLRTHLISSIVYNELNNTVKVEISQGLRDLVLKYRDTFAKLDLEELKKIKSKHTFKLYELFKDYSYHRNHKANVSLYDLFHFLNIEKDSKYRDNISIFNRDILKKAISEINKKTYMQVDYTYHRANKANPEAYYSFSIQDITPYSFNLFKHSMLVYVEQINPNISINYKNKNYCFEQIEAKNKKDMNYMIVNSITGKTLESEEAKNIWEYLHKEANYNTLNFFEDYNIDIDKFQTIYEVSKRRKEKNQEPTKKIKLVIDSKTKEEILEEVANVIIHKNQSTIEDFLND